MPEQIVCPTAPAALGAYSHAIKHNGTLYVSGQLGMVDGKLAEGAAAQAKAAMANLKAILESAGSSLGQVLQCTVLLADIKEFANVDKVYRAAFEEDATFKHFPARACFQAGALPASAAVEICATAACE